MVNKTRYFAVCFVLFSIFFSGMLYGADLSFDFGLTLFGFEEIRFESTKTPDFNFQLLKKYLTEHEGSQLQQLHCVIRWFNLLKLSDTPKRKTLESLSKAYFTAAGGDDAAQNALINRVFFEGLNLPHVQGDKNSEANNIKFEELLLSLEEPLAENGFYWLAKGIVFHHLKQAQIQYFAPMKPEEDLKHAIPLLPKEPLYYYAMGQAFRLLNSNDTPLFLAIACYEKASSLDPRNVKLQNSLLGIYMGLHEEFQEKNRAEPFWLEEAVYKKILSISPTNPHALNNLGYLYAEYGVNVKDAYELCQRAVQINPENPVFRDSFGWAAFKNREFDKAEEELKRSLEMRKNVYEPHYHLATVYYAAKKYEESAAHYEEAVSIKPDSAEALNNLAYLYAEQGIKLESALTYSEKAVKFDPGNGSYLDTLGWVYYRMNKLDSAMLYLKKANDATPGQGEILMHIGQVYLEENDFESAINYLKEAHKLQPELPDSDESLYLAVCLKAYRGALADYHGLLGKNAKPDKIISILLSLARLYQENSLYYKAIEINKLCADIKSGELNLDKPIFNDYKIKKPGKDDEPQVSIQETAESPEAGTPEAVEDGAPAPSEQPENEPASEVSPEASDQSSLSGDQTDMDGFPSPINCPMVVNAGPDFFNFAKAYLPSMEAFKDKSVTLFLPDLLHIPAASIVKITSGDSDGKVMMTLLEEFFSNFYPSAAVKTENCASFLFRNRSLYLRADGDSVYISKKQLSDNEVHVLAEVCPFDASSFAEIVYDWQSLQNHFPTFLKSLIANPLAPFEHIHTKYTLSSGVFREFTQASTGRAEDEEFMKWFSRDLFAFKTQLKKSGVDATIKVKMDGELIYLSTEYEHLGEYIQNRLKGYAALIPFSDFLFKDKINRSICFFNRMFFVPEVSDHCPENGKIYCAAQTDVLTCDHHHEMPAIPLFLSDECACRFGRMRLEIYLKKNTKDEKLSDDELSKRAAELNIPSCALSGTWTQKDNYRIDCSAHH